MSHFELERKGLDGTSLYFQGWQVEGAPKGVVCLVHGLGEHSGRYNHWGEWLNQAGYGMLSYDLRGHGKSEGLRGHVNSFEEYYKDTDLLIKEARERYASIPCFLYGHSLGSIIVCGYVLDRKPQIQGVVLSGLAIKTSLQEQKGKIFLARLVGSVMPKGGMESGLIPETISRDNEIVARYKADPLVHSKVTFGFGRSSLSALSYIDQHAGEWSLPVLVMHGEQDKLGYADGSREFAGRVRGDCTLKIWPGLYHEVHNEPENRQVFEFLRQWLDTHLSVR